MPWVDVARAELPGGEVLTLRECDGAFEIRLNLYELMSSRTTVSEAALARIACGLIHRADAQVLIGGLGMGYTLRAVLDEVGCEARLTVAELVPEIVAWNRGPLADLAGRPLEDARVTVHCGDVVEVLRAHPHVFDCVLMDVDNGPGAVLFESNRGLYSAGGVKLVVSALKPGGVFAQWSADRSPDFERVLAEAGCPFERADVTLRGDGPAHTIYLVRVG
jgi:spermidine synthase